MPQLHPHRLVACFVMLVFAAPTLAKQEPGSFRASPEAVAKARAWAPEALPTAEELGKNWRYAWQLPPGSRDGAASEDAWWATANDRIGLVTMSEAEARQQVDASVAEMADTGMSSRDGRAVMLAMMSSVRPVDTVARRLKMMSQGMASAGSNPQAAMRQSMADLIKPYEGMSEDELTDAIVERLTQVRKATMMDYYFAEDWSKVVPDGAVPGAAMARMGAAGGGTGRVRIQVALIDGALTSTIKPVNAAEAKRLSAELTEQVQAVSSATTQAVAAKITPQQQAQMDQALAMLDQQIANAPNEQVKQQMIAAREQVTQQIAAMGGGAGGAPADDSRVTVRTLGLGDDSYAVRVIAAGMMFSGFDKATALVREGNAIAIVEFTGNFSEPQIDAIVDQVLAKVYARTRKLD